MGAQFTQYCPHILCQVLVLEVPLNHPHFQKSTRRTHRMPRSLLHSWLCFITGKGCRLKSARGRDAQGRVHEGSRCQASSCPLHVEMWTALTPLGINVWKYALRISHQGSSPEPWVSTILIAAQSWVAHWAVLLSLALSKSGLIHLVSISSREQQIPGSLTEIHS